METNNGFLTGADTSFSSCTLTWFSPPSTGPLKGVSSRPLRKEFEDLQFAY